MLAKCIDSYPLHCNCCYRSVYLVFAQLVTALYPMQGYLATDRRNYSGLLQDVASDPELLENKRSDLQIFTWDKQLDSSIVPVTVLKKLVYKHLKYTVIACINALTLHALMSAKPCKAPAFIYS